LIWRLLQSNFAYAVIQGKNRTQSILFPETLDQIIELDNEVHIFDFFVESIHLPDYWTLRIWTNNQPTKSQLLKAFKKSIRQDTKGKVSANSNPWIICNKDSSFYKSDTLRLYNNESYYYHSNCCDFVEFQETPVA